MFHHIYHSKLLLFGEHSLLQGSQGLAVPYAAFSAKWSFSALASARAKESNANLKKVYEYLLNTPVSGFEFRQEKMKKALDNGLWFDSSIPQGYGLGSSGALCAAIYGSFGLNQISQGESISSYELLQLRSILGGIESFFHGASSGIDPLISYLNQSILIRSVREMHLTWPKKGVSGAHLFLIDTGIPRKTGPYVEEFMKLYEGTKFRKAYDVNYEEQVNLAIQTYMEGQGNGMLEAIRHISTFQYRYLPSFIPEAFKVYWKLGIESGAYYLKLCGAGGGGFILGFCENYDLIQGPLRKLTIKRLE